MKMDFSQIQNNEPVVTALRGMVDSGRIPHALLLIENPCSGAMAVAQAFLQYLYCADRKEGNSCGECPSCKKITKMMHPDVHYVFPVNEGEVIKSDHPVSSMGMGAFRELFAANPFFSEQELYSALGMGSKAGNISVNEAKNIISEMSLSTIQDGFRSVVIFLPERMNQAAANKLLKVLEEPPSQTLFILITQSPEDVMSTISSRCQHMRILPFADGGACGVKVGEDISSIWHSMLGAVLEGRLSSALECCDEIAAIKSRDSQRAFCAYASWQIRQLFLRSKGLTDIAYISPEDKLPETNPSSAFCISALNILDKASYLLTRNVGAKMVFTDLVNRLYLNVQNGRKQTI